MSAEQNESDPPRDFPGASSSFGYGGCGAGTPVLPYGVKIETIDGLAGIIVNHRIEDVKEYIQEGPNAEINFILHLEPGGRAVLIHPKNIKVVLSKTSIVKER